MHASALAPLLWVVVSVSLCGAAPCAQHPRVLFLTHSAGFEHAVVKRVQKGRAAVAEKALSDAARGQFEVVASQDCGVINARDLATFDAVVFYTTGELPIDEVGRAALLDYVRGGGAFVGVHSATDTFYQWPEYGALLGAYFDGHPWNQAVAVQVEHPRHPATAHLGATWRVADEIYQFKQWTRADHTVLLSLAPEGADLSRGKRADRDYPLAWCHDVGEGRVFYTALGHRLALWGDRVFLHHLLGGIRWAIGDERVLGRAPEGATVLLGAALQPNAWQHPDGEPVRWRAVGDGDDRGLEVVPKAGSIVTRQAFGDFRLHVEFRVPRESAADRGQARGNSGVYLQRRYEVQILDSHGQEPRADGCGALYRQRAPARNASRPPEEWQSYDIWFSAARFDEAGEKLEDARITVLHNGWLIHDDVALPDKTGAGRSEGPEPGPILLQDHGDPVRFRNVWIEPM